MLARWAFEGATQNKIAESNRHARRIAMLSLATTTTWFFLGQSWKITLIKNHVTSPITRCFQGVFGGWYNPASRQSDVGRFPPNLEILSQSREPQ